MTGKEEDPWPHRTRVRDDRGLEQYVKMRAENGVVYVESPRVFQMNPDETDLLDINFRIVADEARQQRRGQTREH